MTPIPAGGNPDVWPEVLGAEHYPVVAIVREETRWRLNFVMCAARNSLD